MSAVPKDSDAPLTEAEYREVERHKWYLSQRAGYDVGYDAACEDWLRNYAETWRRERQARMLALQRTEIERHKWIESEKARRDLGRDACIDWIHRYAAPWREWYNREHGDLSEV